MPVSEAKRRLRKSKEAERDSGRWLLQHDGADPVWKHIASVTGRVGFYHDLQFDVVSAHYAGEIKNRRLPVWMLDAWLQIIRIAREQGKEPLLIVVPSNVGVKPPALHIITPERHERLLEYERIANGN